MNKKIFSNLACCGECVYWYWLFVRMLGMQWSVVISMLVMLCNGVNANQSSNCPHLYQRQAKIITHGCSHSCFEKLKILIFLLPESTLFSRDGNGIFMLLISWLLTQNYQVSQKNTCYVISFSWSGVFSGTPCGLGCWALMINHFLSPV